MSCDHIWGDPPNEYKKTRTEYDCIIGSYEVCDMCKAIIVDGKTVCYEEELEQYKHYIDMEKK